MYRNMRKKKLILSSKISNLLKLLVSIFSLFTTIFADFMFEKTTFKEFEEIQYNDEN